MPLQQPRSRAIDPVGAADALAADGYAHLSAADVAGLLGDGGRAEWPAFARSWDGLERDEFMRDGGRYRYRRHAVFAGERGAVRRLPDAPHYQAREHNALNGGISRTFAPVTDAIGRNRLLRDLVLAFMDIFDRASARVDPAPWKIEMHQFRIAVGGGDQGLPTPEGMHRDGVDWVVTLFVDRRNVSGGSTTVVDADADPVLRIEMDDPLEAVLIDDHRLRHGVSPIAVVDPNCAGHRDVLVLTFARP